MCQLQIKVSGHFQFKFFSVPLLITVLSSNLPAAATTMNKQINCKIPERFLGRVPQSEVAIN